MERGSLGFRYQDRALPLDKHFSRMVDLRGEAKAPPAPHIFGNAGLEHMERYGTTPEQFARVAQKNHAHSAHNPNAQFQQVYTLDEIMESKTVYGPLTKLQCCPTSDGAAAAILASERFVREHNLWETAVEIAGQAMTTDYKSTFEGDSIKLIGSQMTEQAAKQALAQAKAPQQAEKFYYDVTFGKASVAQVNLFTACERKGSTPAALYAVSRGLADQIHSFAIRFDTFLTPRGLWPRFAQTSITEEGKTRLYKTAFTEDAKASVTSTISHKTRTQALTLPSRGHDMLSWMLHLRARTSWAADQAQTYFVWDGWKLFKLSAIIEQQTSLSTELGDFSVWPVRLERTRYHHDGPKALTPSASKEALGRIYYSTDSTHKPVGIDFKGRVGTAYVRLLKHSTSPCP